MARSESAQRTRDIPLLERARDFLLRCAEQREQARQPADLERAMSGAVSRALVRLRGEVPVAR